MKSDRFAHIQFASSLSARDFSLQAERCGAADLNAIHGKRTPDPDPEAADFVNWLLRRVGLDPALYRHLPLARRVGPCLRALRVCTLAQARKAIEIRPALVTLALDNLLIGVTCFFRDRAVFASLQGAIIPAIAATSHPIRVWSAGCSDGLELYSVAMILADLGVLDRSHLLGTDCRSTAIERARRAIFDRKTVAVVPAWQHYFKLEQERFQVIDSIRERLRFVRQDLFSDHPPEEVDLVLCRNVAIYLQPHASRLLWRRTAHALRPGGFLVTGKAERAAEAGLIRVAQAIYQKAERASDDGNC